MSQEPFSSWFSDTTKALHSCALTLVIFALIAYAIYAGLEAVF